MLKFFVLLFASFNLFANDLNIDVKITSLTNAAKNAVMEVCGTAIHNKGLHPLLVTIHHAESNYTTLTSPQGDWCVVIVRWTFTGKVDVEATTLQ